VFAFLRHTEKDWAITVVPRLVTRLAPAGRQPTGESAWASNQMLLPKGAPTDWMNVLTGEKLKARTSGRGNSLALAEVFSRFPVALLAAG
jgi:maltooligosyltrehalose synthase